MNKPSTLGASFIRLCKEHGKRPLFNDSTGKKVTYRKALMGAFVLGRYLSQFPDRNIGIMLPNLTVTALIFMGLQVFRKVPAFLNYSSGPAALTHAMELADLRRGGHVTPIPPKDKAPGSRLRGPRPSYFSKI